MRSRSIKGILVILGVVTFAALPASYAQGNPQIIEDTKVVMGASVRIQVPVPAGQDGAVARAAIEKAFKESSMPGAGNNSTGSVIDKAVSVLKGCGVNNGFVNSDEEMYSLGMKSDKEMWKAWIPHPTDKKKVFAILRLKDKAIATVRNQTLSASVVADDTLSAEKLAGDLLAGGIDALKAADARGVDALLIIKDGNKLKAEMAGGFKEQYGKSKR